MTEARIVQGEAGKVICKEAERIKPAAVVMGTRGRSLMQRFFLSVSMFYFYCGNALSYCGNSSLVCCWIFGQCTAGKCE